VTDNAHQFVSRQAVRRFTRYLTAQRAAMKPGSMIRWAPRPMACTTASAVFSINLYLASRDWRGTNRLSSISSRTQPSDRDRGKLPAALAVPVPVAVAVPAAVAMAIGALVLVVRGLRRTGHHDSNAGLYLAAGCYRQDRSGSLVAAGYPRQAD
jgi:hypothetical protein